MECALGLMQRLFGLDCSALRCVDIKFSVTNLHVSTVKFERYTCTVTDALATHMQTKIERYVAYEVVLYWKVLTNQLKFSV